MKSYQSLKSHLNKVCVSNEHWSKNKCKLKKKKKMKLRFLMSTENSRSFLKNLYKIRM